MIRIVSAALFAATCLSLPAHAGDEATDARTPRTSVSTDISDEANAAVAAVDAFSTALKTQDFEAIRSALDPAVIVLEAGGAEHNRDEYMGHHAIADAMFMAKAEVALSRRSARADGDTAWVASETETRVDSNGPKIFLGTETMILRKTADGWKIVHIHWSSRPRP